MEHFIFIIIFKCYYLIFNYIFETGYKVHTQAHNTLVILVGEYACASMYVCGYVCI